MKRHEIRFAGRWRVPLPPDAVYARLADLEHYPGWWPAFRSVRRTGDRECEVVIRSALPYELKVRMRPLVEDPAARILSAALEGDIAGTVRWQVSNDGSRSCAASFHEHVTVEAAELRRWMPLARPFFHLNHALAMRTGHRGLLARLGADAESGAQGTGIPPNASDV
ncbi:SRPBCC family protein [Streptomyces roseoverticillatus]|uniref:SRPBCC family protein n=1 Tax=Streptomyces roseoverticillatus TaxID=66429 RepID=UPI0012FEFA55|nr:SRPBCC family protein [Streptomyces roseoverticillatus]